MSTADEVMKVTVLTGPQGSGKSTKMLEDALAKPGLYLIASPTHELIDEQAVKIRKLKPDLKVSVVHSKSGGVGKVSDRLHHACKCISDDQLQHAVILTTHEALMGSSLVCFKGWHARIDEAPSAVQAGKFDCSAYREELNSRFKIHSNPDYEWSWVIHNGEALSQKSLQKSVGSKDILEFYKNAKYAGRLFVNASNWNDVTNVKWFSIWTPLELSHFESVTIAGSSYTSSVGFKACKNAFMNKIIFETVEVNFQRRSQPNIEIKYFTNGHRGSSNYWSTSEGRLQIKKVCDHLSSNLSENTFWSGNTVVQHLMEHRLPGLLIAPNAVGLNKHADLTECAIIFSAKATDGDRPMMEAFGLTEADVERAREDETIAQFVMRGAIRNPDYEGKYDIYVYEKTQAERLQAALTQIHFTNVSITALDAAGIMGVTRPRVKGWAESGDDKKQRLRTKDAARQKQKRAAKAASEGRTPGKPGRPKRNS